jgi:putative transposase
VINRGNGCATVFHTDGDFAAFERLIGEASERLPMRLLAYCLMPSHFHLVLWPRRDGDLSRWMQWLLTAHVRRYHRLRGTSGHVWQGRFKAFPIQRDEHLLTVLRYVERNPLRAGLIKRAEDWPWSSLWRYGRSLKGQATARHSFKKHDEPALTAWPTDRPRNWIGRVNRPETDQELAAIRRSVERSAPFGTQRWQVRIATRLGLESSLRPRGRPRLAAKK